MQFVGGVGS